jgi:hypothetical protein
MRVSCWTPWGGRVPTLLRSTSHLCVHIHLRHLSFSALTLKKHPFSTLALEFSTVLLSHGCLSEQNPRPRLRWNLQVIHLVDEHVPIPYSDLPLLGQSELSGYHLRLDFCSNL